jgi:hypothetical protein
MNYDDYMKSENDKLYEAQKQLKTCDWCEKSFPNLNEVDNPHALLCEECEQQFYNSESPRDYCSLQCVMCGHCDESC